jgi:hypothetical protein
MIITKESEEFQNLLKKVEYLENVIRCSKYYIGCDPYKPRKELPKTVYEFEKVLKDFASEFYASDYLTKRDKEVELFLQINNYK